MPREIRLKEGNSKVFSDEEPSWLALDLPELKPPIYANAFIVFLALFFLTVLIYSAFTTVPVIIESTGKIVTERPAVPVRSLSSFTVEQLLVRENQEVKADQILVTSSEGMRKSESLVVEALLNEFNLLTQQRPEQLCRDCLASQRKISLLFSKLKPRSQLQQLIRPPVEQTALLTGTMLKLKKVEPQMANLRPQFDKLNQLLISYQKAPPSPQNMAQIEKIKKLQQPYQLKMSEIAKPFMEDLDRNFSEIRIATRDLQANLEQFSRLHSVKAPFDGRVINIKIKGGGELLGSGQLLMEIVPQQNSLVAAIDVLNRDIGAVKVDDIAELSFDAYPEMDYGHIDGRVVEILPGDITDNAQANPYQEKAFKVHVALNAQVIVAQNQSYNLLPGMTLHSRIIKRQETLLRTFYRSIFKLKEDIKVRN